MECACFLLAPKNASLLFNPVAVHTINTDTPAFLAFSFSLLPPSPHTSLRSSGLQRSAREMLSGVILRNGRIAVEARNEAVRAQKTGMNAKTMLTLEAKARGAEQVAMRATDMVGVNGDPIRCKADLPAPSSPSRPSSTSSNSDGGRAYVKEKSNKKWLAAHGKGGGGGRTDGGLLLPCPRCGQMFHVTIQGLSSQRYGHRSRPADSLGRSHAGACHQVLFGPRRKEVPRSHVLGAAQVPPRRDPRLECHRLPQQAGRVLDCMGELLDGRVPGPCGCPLFGARCLRFGRPLQGTSSHGQRHS